MNNIFINANIIHIYYIEKYYYYYFIKKARVGCGLRGFQSVYLAF
nr:MAG TPA: hypothetical protein [Caudoviricetes sp.]